MVNLTINGNKVTVPDDYTIMKAAASIGIEIPGLCPLQQDTPVWLVQDLRGGSRRA